MPGMELMSGVKLDLLLGGTILKSTFFEAMGEDACLISVPLKSTKVDVSLPNQELTMSFARGNERFTCRAMTMGVRKIGMRNYLELKLTESPVSQRRTYLRLQATIPTMIMRSGDSTAHAAQTLDISSGGAAVETDVPLGIGESIQIVFRRKGLEKRPFDCEVCWLRRAESTRSFPLAVGVRFAFENRNDETLLQKLLENQD